ncbi:MAG: hypothetical protein ABR497_06955, partial [Kiritimatiellia bacterium]
MTKQYGADFTNLWPTVEAMRPGLWNHDEGGSLNAVYGLLRTLGVRWFMPGALGEVLPAQSTIRVGPLDETVHPDYPLRAWMWYNYSSFGFNDVIWARRAGMNSGHEQLGPLRGPHGMVAIHRRQ